MICQPIRAFVELFHSSCDACVQYNSCEDLLIKTRQGFPSNNVENNIDIQQGNNSNDVEILDDVRQSEWRHCPRQKFLIVKSSKFPIFFLIFFCNYEIILVLSLIGSMENRFFCIKQNSKISEKFELPQPTLDLNSIPALLALNGQPELGMFYTDLVLLVIIYHVFVCSDDVIMTSSLRNLV